MKSLKFLKDQAKEISRQKGLALHKALDYVAHENGFADGWSGLSLKKWSYDSAGLFSQTEMSGKMIRQIDISSLIHFSDEGEHLISAGFERTLSKLVCKDVLRFVPSVRNLPPVESDFTVSKALFQEGTISSVARHFLTLSEKIFDNPGSFTLFQNTRSSVRGAFDHAVQSGFVDPRHVFQASFIPSEASIEERLDAFESGENPCVVLAVHSKGHVVRNAKFSREEWIEMMSAFTQERGPVTLSHDNLVAFLDRLGFKEPQTTDPYPDP